MVNPWHQVKICKMFFCQQDKYGGTDMMGLLSDFDKLDLQDNIVTQVGQKCMVMHVLQQLQLDTMK